MGLILKAIPLERVIAVLAKKGYGVAQMRRYALALNKGTGQKWDSGSEKRVTVGGVSHAVLDEILMRSETPEEAADRVERAVLGQEMLPIEEARAATRQDGGMDLAALESLIVNRVASEVGRVVKPNLDQIPDMVRDAVRPYLEQMEAAIAAVRAVTAKPAPRPRTPAQIAHTEKMKQMARDRAAAQAK